MAGTALLDVRACMKMGTSGVVSLAFYISSYQAEYGEVLTPNPIAACSPLRALPCALRG